MYVSRSQSTQRKYIMGPFKLYTKAPDWDLNQEPSSCDETVRRFTPPADAIYGKLWMAVVAINQAIIGLGVIYEDASALSFYHNKA